MKFTTVSALTALLFAGAQAVPMAGQHNHKAPAAHAHMHHRNKRDIVWETVFEVETVVVMKTVYADGTEATEPASSPIAVVTPSPIRFTSYDAPAPSSPQETESSSAAAVTTPSTTTTETPAPAPATTSSTTSSTTSAYVAPPAPTTLYTTTEAPAPTTYVAPEPVPTTTTTSPPAPAPVTSSAAATTSAASSGGSSGGATYTGDATYWDPALGACGWTNSDGEDVVAISHVIFDPDTPNGNPNNNPLCGKMVAIKSTDGSTIQAKVVDRCTGCAAGDLDMTRTLFKKVAPNGDGRVGGMEWSWA